VRPARAATGQPCASKRFRLLRPKRSRPASRPRPNYESARARAWVLCFLRVQDKVHASPNDQRRLRQARPNTAAHTTRADPTPFGIVRPSKSAPAEIRRRRAGGSAARSTTGNRAAARSRSKQSKRGKTDPTEHGHRAPPPARIQPPHTATQRRLRRAVGVVQPVLVPAVKAQSWLQLCLTFASRSR